MDNAFCTINNQTYNAYQFSQFDMGTISQLRRFLECPSCHAPAFFRKASRNGQAACFGARPHNSGCDEIAPTSRLINGENNEEDILYNDGQQIVLDLNFGSQEPVNHVDEDIWGNGTGQGGRFVGNGNRPNAVTRRRLSTMLRSLVLNPSFRDSQQNISIGEIQSSVREFFVQFNEINTKHINNPRGYWGQIVDVGQGSNDTIWLNSGNRDDVSLCLPVEMQPSFFHRFKITDLEDLIGSYVLYLGDLRKSAAQKYYIVIDDLAFLTCY